MIRTQEFQCRTEVISEVVLTLDWEIDGQDIGIEVELRRDNVWAGERKGKHGGGQRLDA